jgi:hypothetical protein
MKAHLDLWGVVAVLVLPASCAMTVGIVLAVLKACAA